VVIMADDMRADDLRWMPSTRRLVRDRGVAFANSFASLPLCCPSRASFLTVQPGRRPGAAAEPDAAVGAAADHLAEYAEARKAIGARIAVGDSLAAARVERVTALLGPGDPEHAWRGLDLRASGISPSRSWATSW
jgi:arylsulfatase A-like enzyme